ncbi:phage tail protein [Hymenobacter rubripertinctus]|uniref:Phage tail protein n=1 Tax=Hymenobacter rubripertinctus TaxID=2029981 RepID=A0A418R6Y4_9BACT|nr:tail fiber protein [Hymenobacter rubripertinctus]RIY13278.1 phage tail protein [Hymenobacter rubripertinctus]
MEPILGEIRLVGFNFAPRGWALCNGSLLSIQQNTALFSLLGVTYGGDGRTTFALPNLQSRAALHSGQGPGLSSYPQGTMAGTETVTLLSTQMPAHTHPVAGTLPLTTNNVAGGSDTPAGNFLAKATSLMYGEEAAAQVMAANSVTGTAGVTGGGTAHENRMPYLSMYYVIALQGIFPQRQ